MELLDYLRKIKKYFNSYRPTIEIFISKSSILNNLKAYQEKYAELLFAPVLKSNAYGHGLVEVAKILDREKIVFLVVDSLHEAIVLRSKGIKAKILIIGFTQVENIKNLRLSNISFTIISLEQLQQVNKYVSREIKIHLKIDTGMHRQGIPVNQIEEAINILKNNKKLILEGICSHFADADGSDKSFTKKQIIEWEKVVLMFKERFAEIKFFHLSNSAGTYYTNEFFSNVARLGLGLYGINPSPFSNLSLKPALKMQSLISSVRELPEGEGIGYNVIYKTEERSRIATVPVGYYEGIDRRLSSKGSLKVNNIFCRIVGRVSMNISSIDVTSALNVKVGDKVIIISDNKNDENSIENMAKTSDTIPWEILIHIPKDLRRVIIE